MPIIAHISDLHFGSVNAPIAEALGAELRDVAPDLLVVSGDLTQRGRRRQYAAAAEYLAGLPRPQIVVPGNHDIPLFDVVRRFYFPLDRYRRHITANLSPFYRDDAIAILGINTARSWAWSWKGFWRDGRISAEQQLDVERRFFGIPAGVFKIVVTHHPFIPPPRRRVHGIVGGAAAALEVLRRCGVDMLLAGHLHTSYSGDVRPHYETINCSILSVQAGSTISTRLRREPNAYNVIVIKGGDVTVTARSWAANRFVETSVTRYQKVGDIWQTPAPRPRICSRPSPGG